MTALDRDAWLAMHRAIFGATEWTEGEILRVTGATPGRKDFGSRGVVPAADADAAWQIIERCAQRGQNTYISIGVQHASAADAAGRGKKADVAALPALVVDLDIQSGVHSAGDKNPTLDEVDEWIADNPLGPPTVTVHTGGGLHAWYVLDTPIDPFSEDGADVLARHKAWWAARAAQAGRNIDEGVLADIARVLRPAGSLNLKAAPLPIALRSVTENRVSVADIQSKLPAVEVKKRQARVMAGDRPARVTVRDLTDGARPSDRFALTVDVESFCSAVFGAEMSSASGISMPDEHGDVPDRDAGRLFVGESGEQRVTWFSTTVQAGFGLDSAEHNHTAFDVLAHGVGGAKAGYRRAGKLVEAWEGHWDSDDFVTVCQAALTGACHEAFAVDAPEHVPAPPVRPTVVAVAEILEPEPPVIAPEPMAAAREQAVRARASIQASLAVIFATAAASEPKVADEAAVPKLGCVTVETGGGVVRIQYGRNSFLEGVLNGFVREGRSQLSRRTSPGTAVFEMSEAVPDELAAALRAAGFTVDMSTRDGAAEGCQIRCYPRSSYIDGEHRCDRHGGPSLAIRKPQ